MTCIQHGHGGIAEALNARMYGTGTQTLVLAHGYGADQSVWHYLIPYLVCYFRVVVFDLVISGNVRPELYDQDKYSTFDGYAQDLKGVLEELNVTDSIYLGHSMSAMVGCLASTSSPHLFKHLILLGGSPRYLNAKNYVGGFDRSDINALFHDIKRNFSSWASGFAPKAIGVNDTKSVQEFRSSLDKMNPRIALDAAETVFRSDLRKILKQVKVPCTIIQSAKDFVVPKSVASYMASKLGSRSKVRILNAHGHLPQLTAYPLLLKVLKDVVAADDR
ncbi:strigolactone esterase D14-like [Aristolochia californica]|uniref:strigolactone esterase D14-like n=1 Tax=Aristolochia californica TaxID=171875 RepID=UPI0035D5FE41